MPNSADESTPLETLREHVKDVRMAMLSTMNSGRMASRPMSVHEFREDGTISFLTSADSHKVTEITANPSVGVAVVDPGAERGLGSISGPQVPGRALIVT